MTKYHDPVPPPEEWLQEFLKAHTYNPLTGEIDRPSSKYKIGSKNNGYILIGYKGIRRYAHHLAWFLYYKEWPKATIDHKDRNRLNNRIDNLELSNMSLQAINHPSRSLDLKYVNQSIHGKGIYFRKGRYEVYINRKPKREYLGVYYTLEEAQKAVKAYHDRAQRKD